MCYEGDGFYLASFPFSGGGHGYVERTIIEVRDGLCYTTADGPLMAAVHCLSSYPITCLSRNCSYGLLA
jgi:hypothetical protein